MEYFTHASAQVEDGCRIGAGTKIWHFAHIRRGAEIGQNCVIAKNVFVDFETRIGNNVKIQNNVSVYHGVEIADGVFVGPHVCFTNDKLPRAVSPDGSPLAAGQWTLGRIIIEKGAAIGANSTIVAGVTVGAWSMVGAGSVVTKNVPPHALIYGNPARVHGIVSKSGEILAKIYKPGKYSTTDGKESVEIS